MLQSDWLRYSLSIRQYRYRVGASNTQGQISRSFELVLLRSAYVGGKMSWSTQIDLSVLGSDVCWQS